MKVYITKYVLTAGEIYEKEVQECEISGMVRVLDTIPPEYYQGEGRDWHRTCEAAVRRAEEMRNKKLDSLRKQIKKLWNLSFE